jgi:2-methylcitrate dehydratase PrpD
MGVTRDIAEWMHATDYGMFDDYLVTYTKELIVDALGSSIAGAKMPAGISTMEYVRLQGAREEAGVIGGGFRTSMEFAALANGATSHVTELEDDAHPEDCYTCGVLPGVFAVGDALRLSGKQMIEGCILAYEVAVKLSGKNPEMLERGLLTGSYFGGVAIAGAVAKLMGLDVDRTVDAMSLAASMGCGLVQQHGTGAHLMESGYACRNGVAGALQASVGLTGKPDILEHPKGMCHAVSGIEELEDLGLGDYRLRKGVVMKKYPACSLQHSIIRGCLELIEEQNLKAEEVEHIRVDAHQGFLSFNSYHHPENYMEAPFALPHALAVCFLEDEVFLDQYTDEKVHDPKIHEMRERVDLKLHPEWDLAGVAGKEYWLTVTLKNGMVHERICPAGEDNITLSESELKDRYWGCVRGNLDEKKAEQALAMMLDLENVDDVSELMNILSEI